MSQGSTQSQKAKLMITAAAPVHGLWVLDSVASQDFCQDKSLLQNERPSCLQHVSLADGSSSEVLSEGSVFFHALGHTFIDDLCVPSLENNLLSVYALDKACFMVCFGNKSCEITKDGQSDPHNGTTFR